MKHVWLRDKIGRIKHFDQGQYHDGPECMICCKQRCTGCSKTWEAEECAGDLTGVDWRKAIETVQADVTFWELRAKSLEADKVRLTDQLVRARTEAANAHHQAESEFRDWLNKAIARRDILRAAHNEEGA